MAILIRTSVTRFGEISPSWQKFTGPWQISGGVFLIGQIVEPTFGEFAALLGYFLHCKWSIIKI